MRIVRMVVVAVGIRLPDLDHGIVQGRALHVENAAPDAYPFAGNSRRRNLRN
jgi:hypothetical protein